MRSTLGKTAAIAAFCTLAQVGAASAEVKVGIVQSLSGSASAQGISLVQAAKLAIPDVIGDEKVAIIVLDDATDPAIATRNAKKLIEEENVDVIYGASITPSSIAVAQVATAAGVPLVANAPVNLGGDRNTLIFNVPPPPVKWIIPAVEDMRRRGVKTVGFLGFSDAWGDISFDALKAHAEKGGYKIVADERYARADTSVTGQVLRLMAAKPDAIFLGVAGTPGVLGNVSIVERGYRGPIYNGVGIFNQTFVTLGGARLEGIYATIGAVGLGQKLPDSDARKPVVMDFIKKYEAKYGSGTADALTGFGYDAGLVTAKAIEAALKSGAKSGTPKFRQAIADGMRSFKDFAGVHSIYNFSDPSWPWGVGDDAAFLVKIEKGKWEPAS